MAEPDIQDGIETRRFHTSLHEIMGDAGGNLFIGSGIGTIVGLLLIPVDATAGAIVEGLSFAGFAAAGFKAINSWDQQ